MVEWWIGATTPDQFGPAEHYTVLHVIIINLNG
jgi:hypothetical protein